MVGEEINSAILSIVPIITAGIALIGTKWVVSDWQKRKDKSEIKKEVLKNFNFFKNRALLMDNFVAELIFEYAKFDNSLAKEHRAPIVRPKEHGLSKLLPWHFSYEDLEYYSIRMDWEGLTNFEDKTITRETIIQRIKTLENLKECYIDFQKPPLEVFRPQFMKFKKKFNNYSADLEFKTLADLYYAPEKKGNKRNVFLKNFSGMWEYMMACYVLVNTIMYTTNEDTFVQKIEIYKKSNEQLFYFIEWFERKLILEKIRM